MTPQKIIIWNFKIIPVHVLLCKTKVLLVGMSLLAHRVLEVSKALSWRISAQLSINLFQSRP